MPTIPQQETIVQYVANSSQTAYTFAFYAPLPSDIDVYYQAANATPIPSADILDLNIDYTVTYNADPITGGTITLLFTPTSGFYLTINRNVEASLTTNFAAAQDFNGANLDAALDRLLLLCQQNLNYALARNLSYIINTYLPSAQPFTQLPPLAQNQVWIGSGSGVIAGTIAQVPSASMLQAMLANASPGTDGARIVGYYDSNISSSTTVSAFLNNLPNYLNNYFDGVVSSYAVDSGVANIYVGNPAIPLNSYVAGQPLFLKIAHTNTSATCTANFSGLGAKSIKLTNGANPNVGDLVAGMIAEFNYDGTNLQLLNPVIGSATYNIAASGYYNLPGGLIAQWGISNNLAPGSFQNITLPLTFPNAGLALMATPQIAGGTGSGATCGGIIVSTSQISVTNTSTTGANFLIYWMAIGH